MNHYLKNLSNEYMVIIDTNKARTFLKLLFFVFLHGTTVLGTALGALHMVSQLMSRFEYFENDLILVIQTKWRILVMCS